MQKENVLEPAEAEEELDSSNPNQVVSKELEIAIQELIQRMRKGEI